MHYRGRQITQHEIAYIKDIIEEDPKASRYSLSKRVCEAWDWRQTNGILKDMTCRGMLLWLENQGQIKLPPRKQLNYQHLLTRNRPEKIEADESPVEGKISDIGPPIRLKQVRRTDFERVYDGLIETHHYLKYTQPVGEYLKYIAFTGSMPVGCLGWSSAVRHIKSRDRFIGWSAEQRKKNLHLTAYNTRFLILPWVKVHCIASYLLGLNIRGISRHWQELYNHPIYYLETFIDTERFKGTCYRASNWIYLGDTTGRGKNDNTNKPNRSIKAVYGYPLTKKFREILCNG